MHVEIKSAPDQKIAEQAKKTVLNFLKETQISADLAVSVSFVGPQKIRSLNRRYRKLDRATDVLSFPLWPNRRSLPKKGLVNLGDIFVSWDDICKNAQENQVSPEVELQKMLVHSLNHLLGKHH